MDAVGGYGRILVPVDGGPASARGLLEATRVAALTGGEIRLVHVLDPSAYANGFETSRTYCNEVLPLMRRDGARILEEARAAVLAAGREATTVLVERLAERVCDMVIEQAQQWHAELIVIGSHGRRGWHRALMGSDAEQLMRRSPIPVLVVRGDDPDPQPSGPIHTPARRPEGDGAGSAWSTT